MLPKKLKFLASLQLAVIILIAIALISAVGTFYESLYNAEYASLVVYQSYWMWLIQIALAVNLTAVMADRWPWKKRHTPFLLAHVGILVVLAGTLLTYYRGIDGLMVLPVGSSNRYVEISDKVFAVYVSTDGNAFPNIFSERVDFYKSFKKNKEVTFQITPEEAVVVEDHYIFAETKSVIQDSQSKADGPALRFFIEGARARDSGWLVANKLFKEDSASMGPAKIKLALKKPETIDLNKNEILFYPSGDDSVVSYTLKNKSGSKEGELKIGEVLETGWMDFKLRVVSYKRHARAATEFEKLERPHALSTEAVKVKFQGQEYWMAANQPLKIFNKDRVYILSYGNRKIDIGFNIKLKKFNVGRYQGTMKASSYESVISLEGKNYTISMNEPFKKDGLTFYQSSFQEDEMGKPTHSVLSVNKDPGRPWKYFGCFLIALGTILLFWFKKMGHKWRFF